MTPKDGIPKLAVETLRRCNDVSQRSGLLISQIVWVMFRVVLDKIRSTRIEEACALVLYVGNQSFARMKEKGYSYQYWDRRGVESNSSYILLGNGRSDLVWIEMSEQRLN